MSLLRTLAELAPWFESVPTPVPGHSPNYREVKPTREVADERTPLPRRHHPLLDSTAIAVRQTHMDYRRRRLCFCCDAEGCDEWLCDVCRERGCGQ